MTSEILNSKITVPIGKFVRDVTLTIEISPSSIRWYRLRLKLAKPLLTLAAKVIGCGIEIRTPTQMSGSTPLRKCSVYSQNGVDHYPGGPCPASECSYPHCLKE